MQLQCFEGHWRIERTIEDVRDHRTGRLTGSARFDPASGGLIYLETGTLKFPGSAAMRASRRYLWRDGGAGTIDILFEDGRFFHRFDAEDATPATSHTCAPDLYRVLYDFRAWPRWQAEWRVTGPSKNYSMVTTYTPGAEA